MAGKKPTEGEEPEEGQQKPAAKASKAAAKSAPESGAQEPAASEASAEKAPAGEKKPRRSRAKKPAADAVSEDATEATKEKPETAEEEPEAVEEEPEATEEKPEPAAREKPQPRVPYEGSVRVVRAHARHVRTSARKARLVCDHLRGKSVEEARAILAFNPRGAARDWSKVLESAIANAENNHELVAEDLVVTEAFADEGPTIKRFQPRARGRASSIRKRTSHLTIALSPERR